MQPRWSLFEARFKIIMAGTIWKTPFWKVTPSSIGEINDV